MNPILYGTLRARLGRNKRTCPACQHEQVVPANKKREGVLCKFCGAKIPPPRPAHPSR